MNNVYQIVTDNIIQVLKDGEVPWRRAWSKIGTARNGITGRKYTGVNQLLLSLNPDEIPLYATFTQIKQLGGTIKKGAKSKIAIFWKSFFKKEIEAKEKPEYIFVLKYYNLFAFKDWIGVDPHKEILFQENPPAASIVEKYEGKGPKVIFAGEKSFYDSTEDVVYIPNANNFENSEHFYSTFFHELSHSTGHEKRLKRIGVTEKHSFGDPVYSKEELVAEISSAFLCAHAGLDNLIKVSPVFLQAWIKKLESEPRLFIQAAGLARKSADYILGNELETEV